MLYNIKLKRLLVYAVVGFTSYFMYHHSKIIHKNDQKKYYVYCKKNDSNHLKSVFSVLDSLGFERTSNESDWDLLWAHEYPFNKLSNILHNLKSNQKVNHFPGCGYLTNKIDLSTSNNLYLPMAFKIPQDEKLFKEYVLSNSDKLFVEKLNGHRGIKIKSWKEFNFTENSNYFIQEFIERPFLIDGFKFDVGIYTVITSIDPLRVYTFQADVLFRFCPIEYYPFDPEVLDKYIVGDDYLPIWEVPSLKYYYNKLGFSMKDSFNAYLKTLGKNSEIVWERIEEAIKEVILMKENDIKISMNKYGSGRNFFELMRFDFIIDEELRVFMLEANMSPNLSPAHYPPNRLLYEQVIFNTFALIGIGRYKNF